MNDPTPARVQFDAAPPTRLLDAALRQNLTQLVYLRWIAAIGQLLTIGVVSATLHIQLPVDNMMMVLGCLVAFNGITMMRLTMDHPVSRRELLFALLEEQHLLFDGSGCDEFVGDHLFILADPVGAIDCLQLSGRVPPGVKEHHIVGFLKVKTGASGFQRDQEKLLQRFIPELFYHPLPFGCCSRKQ